MWCCRRFPRCVTFFCGDERLFYLGICTPADLNNDNKETGSDSGLSLEKLSLQPRKKLLVLSLIGLLLYLVYRKNKAKFPTTRDPDARFSSQLVFKRPFAAEFVEFCLERFEVAKKSQRCFESCNGKEPRRQRKKLSVIFAQDDCTYSGSMSMEDKEKPLFLKELKDLWKYLLYSEPDTLLIDDQPYKALLNPPYIGIFLESYNPDNAGDNALAAFELCILNPKGELGVYLDDLAAADNVQVYVKKNPFGVPAISSGHPDWNLYPDVIQRLKGESEKASTSQQLDSRVFLVSAGFKLSCCIHLEFNFCFRFLSFFFLFFFLVLATLVDYISPAITANASSYFTFMM
ncbi:putative FCP1 domain, HAD-like domain-containing protein [Rosa chinensis]|uniref:Mitochondrial import inner membrane translocase subunit TIM50 n=1 Tax=Rosa chinensis TaxID=74649 RepID=A0A2P6RBG1_ROSCH|nr:putative FCP1 domain, HAD-like domain-containing protein [Rosa chinensis]